MLTVYQRTLLDFHKREGAASWWANVQAVFPDRADAILAENMAIIGPLYASATDKRPLAERLADEN